MDYKGKTAAIPGGASGVGKALGSRLVREGMQVVLSDVEKGPLEGTIAELNPLGEVSGVVCDVSKFDQVENLAAEGEPDQPPGARTLPRTACRRFQYLHRLPQSTVRL